MSNNKKAAVKWASDDDAGDLLAGILDETQTEAELEQQRIEAEIRQREEEARRQKEEEERLRRAEAEARISAEMDRLQEVEKRRTQKLEALKIEELKESGQWEPPKPAEIQAPAPEAQVQVAAQHAPVPQAVPAAQAAPAAAEKKSNAVPLAILGGVLGLVVVAGGVVFALMSGGYQVDNTAYSKAVYTPKDPQASLVDKAFAPIPKEEPVAEVEEAAPARSSTRSSRPASRSSSTASSSGSRSRPARSTVKKSDSKKSKAIDGLDLNFDPFGSGF